MQTVIQRIGLVFAPLLCAAALFVPSMAWAAPQAGQNGVSQTGQGLTVENKTASNAVRTSAYPTPVPAGTYIILRNDTGAMALDVAGGSKKNGANIQLYAGNNTSAQLWRISYDKSGLYTIVNAGSGKALDVSGGIARNGRNVWQYEKNGTKAQKWILVETDAGIRIESAINRNFVIDCAGGGRKNGTNIQLYRKNNTAAQLFYFLNTRPKVKSEQTIPNGVYTIETKLASNKLLDVDGASLGNGANVQLYKANHTPAQRWSVVWGKDGYYTITSVVSGKVLDVESASKLPGSNVWQYASNSTDAQKWAIKQNADGTYTLTSKCSGMNLVVKSGATSNGTNIQVARPSGAKAQKFVLKKVSVLAEGTYSFFPKSAQSQFAFDIPSASIKAGVQSQVWQYNDSAAQRFILTYAAGDVCTLQSVASGKYLTDAGGKVVQQVLKEDAATDAQKWKLAFRGSGVVLTNVATGKAIAVSGGKAANGKKLVTASYAGKATEKFRPQMHDGLFGQGLYSFASALNSNKVMDVAGASWGNNANAQLYKANNTNAQKFALVPASGGYYHILMALSGNALVAASNKEVANVRLTTSINNSAEQLWKVELTGNGMVITNKASGSVLEVAGSKTADGTNIRVAPATGKPNQSWTLGATQVNMQDTGALRTVIKGAPTGGRPRLDANGYGYSVSKGAYDQLMNALAKAWNRGKSVGFMMVDINTGITYSLNADSNYYGASTSKAALVTYMYQELIERGKLSYGSVEGLMWDTAVWSNNDTYGTLYSRYAGSGYRNWLSATGVGWVANSQYTTTTPRNLALVWARILAYEQSGGRYVGKWHRMFNRGYYSFIREAIGGSNTVYSKPGWMFGGSYGTIHDDAAIVRDSSGRTYLLSVMTTLHPDADRGIAKDVVRALDRIHREMP